MKTVFIGILIIHLLIHSMGFVKAFKLKEIPSLTEPISTLQGVFWLFCTLSFFTLLIFYSIDNPIWAVASIPTVILSEILIGMNWKDAKYGTILNSIILVMALITLLGY